MSKAKDDLKIGDWLLITTWGSFYSSSREYSRIAKSTPKMWIFENGSRVRKADLHYGQTIASITTEDKRLLSIRKESYSRLLYDITKRKEKEPTVELVCALQKVYDLMKELK